MKILEKESPDPMNLYPGQGKQGPPPPVGPYSHVPPPPPGYQYGQPALAFSEEYVS